MSSFPALWHHATDIEVLQALPKIYDYLDQEHRIALVDAILAGPPIDAESRKSVGEDSIEHQIYLRLEALGEKARKEHPTAAGRYKLIIDAHPSWVESLEERLARREPEVYFKSTVKSVEHDTRPENIVDTILSRGTGDADDFFSLAGLSLATRSAAIAHACTVEGGGTAVQVLLNIGREEVADKASQAELLEMLAEMPSAATRQGHREVATLLEILSDTIDVSALEQFFIVWDGVIEECLSTRDEAFRDGPPDYLTGAINSSSGRATHALLNLLPKTDLKRDAGVPPAFRLRLEFILRSTEPGAFYGSILVASRLYLLSWLDLHWTKNELTPRLSWRKPVEAAGVWQGYLWNPRMDGRLFEAIRADFVDAFSHVEAIGGLAENLCGLLVSLAIDAPNTMTADETRQCLRAMDSPSRQRVAWLLAKRLEATEVDKRAALWRDRIDAWIRTHWPIEADFADGEVSERLAWAATFSEDAFPEALVTILPFLTTTRDPLLTLSALDELDLCGRYPDECLQLLDRLLGDCEDRHYLHGLGALLRKIRSAKSTLVTAPPYQRLRELAQALGDAP